MIPILYKVWGHHTSHIRHEDTLYVGGSYIHVGDHTIPFPYKVRGDYKIPIPYKLCRDHK